MTDDATSEADQVAALEAIVRAAHEQNPSASPAWLATAAMQSIGFRREIHPVGYHGLHQTLERIARAVAVGKDQAHIVSALRAGIDPAAKTAADDLPVIDANADALLARADTLDRHADLLEAFNGSWRWRSARSSMDQSGTDETFD
jgi:hypothetical protein